MGTEKRDNDTDRASHYQVTEQGTVAKKRKLDMSRDAEDSIARESTPEDLKITLRGIESPGDDAQMKVNKYIKHILNLWESQPTDTPLVINTKKSLFPMLVKLRKNSLSSEHLTSLMTIMYYIQQRDFLKAEESYMKLSIGNVAWPIGLIGVSIHARAKDSRLEQGQANIMIDEETRKWITGVKRLVTFMGR